MTRNPKESAEQGICEATGHDAARMIRQNPQAWQATADWLQQLPLPQRNPQTPEPATVANRLVQAWAAALTPFSHRESEDRFHGFRDENARRIVLLAALTFDPDFDGAELGLTWPWEQGSQSLCDRGRSWAAPMLRSQDGQMELLAEFLTMAMRRLTGHSSRRIGESEASFTLTEADIEILKDLTAKRTRVPADLLNPKNVGQGKLKARLPVLEKNGLVDRAEGKRSGWAITGKGRAACAPNPYP